MLGLHGWLEEIFQDAGGDILYMHVSVYGVLCPAAVLTSGLRRAVF